MDKFALIEIGDNDKNEYWFLKGGDLECKELALAHTYWYPDNITQEEIDTEIRDLAEHYENVAILLPISAQLQFEVLPHE